MTNSNHSPLNCLRRTSILFSSEHQYQRWRANKSRHKVNNWPYSAFSEVGVYVLVLPPERTAQLFIHLRLNRNNIRYSECGAVCVLGYPIPTRTAERGSGISGRAGTEPPVGRTPARGSGGDRQRFFWSLRPHLLLFLSPVYCSVAFTSLLPRHGHTSEIGSNCRLDGLKEG